MASTARILVLIPIRSAVAFTSVAGTNSFTTRTATRLIDLRIPSLRVVNQLVVPS